MIIQSLQELEMYVYILQEDKEKVYTDYKELVVDLKENFNIDTTEIQISKLYEPNLEEEVEDLTLILKNIYGY